LKGLVSSPYTPTLRSAFGDSSFHVGGIEQGISPPFPVTEPALAIWLLVLLFFVGLAIVGTPVAALNRLSGTLTLVPQGYALEELEDRWKEAHLRGWRVSVLLDELIGKPGRLIVRRSDQAPIPAENAGS
jgi:hypothetical protein